VIKTFPKAMNKKSIYIFVAAVAAALLIGIGVGRFALSPDADHAGHASATGSVMDSTTGSDEPTTWTCSMHPQIQQPEPGDCPICGMDLIPLEKDAGADDGPRVMSMSEASRALADIQTTEVIRDFPVAEVSLVGKLAYDETREKSLTARFPARIDELFVNYTGIRVNQGDHLAKVYSPELLSAQRELLTAYRADPGSSITRAAREKLRLWDLLPAQIEALIESGEAKDQFVLKAPISGIVVTKNVKEGDYLKTGETLFKIVDLSVLWANLAAYESDLPWLRYGQEVGFTVESFPGESFHGQIVFIEPEVDPVSRTIPIRVNVPNEGERLKPGMFVRAVVASKLAAAGEVYAPDFAGKWISPMHPEVVKDGPGQCDVCGMDLVPAEALGYVDHPGADAPLIVPTSAVLRTGKRAVVYLEKPNTERPSYEGREVVLGPRAGGHYIITAGLDAGDRVVTNGAFKIDSALQIQAKPSMMSAHEGAKGEGYGKDGPQGEGRGARDESEAPQLIAADQLDALLPHYLHLQKALADDNLNETKNALKALMQVTGHEGRLAKLIHDMMAAEDIDGIRRPHFETLSNALIDALKASPLPQAHSPSPLYIMHCPMVYDDRGADWLQSSEALRNPYFGASMLKCGEIIETWGLNGAQDEGRGKGEDSE